MSTKRPPWWQGAALPVVVACLLFTQSLSGDFTFDDRAAVKENRDVVQAGAPWKQLLGDDFWGGRADLELSNKSYRCAYVHSMHTAYSLGSGSRREVLTLEARC